MRIKWDWYQIETEKHVEKVAHRVARFAMGQIPATKLGHSPIEQQMRLVEQLDQGRLKLEDLGDDTISQHVKDGYSKWTATDLQRREMKSRAAFSAWVGAQSGDGQHAKHKTKGDTISDHIEAWLAAERGRYEGGNSN